MNSRFKIQDETNFVKVESCHADYNSVIENGQRAFPELKALNGV